MKLYYHPASRTSRPLSMLVAEHGLDVDPARIQARARLDRRTAACRAQQAR
jgi:hypothetical protein